MYKNRAVKSDASGEHERCAGGAAAGAGVIDERFRATFEQTAVGLTHGDFAGRFLHVNRRFCRLVGYDESEILAMAPGVLTHPDDRGRQRAGKAKLLRGEVESVACEKRYVYKSGRAIWVRSTLSVARDEHGQPAYFVGVVEDISEHKQFEAHQRAVVENAPVGVWQTGLDKRTMYVNRKLCDMLGYSKRELMRLNSRDIVLAEHYGADNQQFERLNAGEIESFSSERPLRRKDGSVIWVNRTVSAVRDAAGTPLYHVRVMVDITEQKRAAIALKESEQRFRQLAHYDTLTGLPNRVLFNERLKQHIAQARRRGDMAAVMLLGLDRFKVANDTLGHAVGDELLKQVSQRLSTAVRGADTVARLSGDEFGLVLGDVRVAEDARTVAQKILDTLAAPFCLNGYELYVTASIGVSLCPADGETEHALIKHADTAMARAKESGRNNFQFFSAEMNTRTLQRLEMENGLRRAVERKEFLLHYQPKVDLASGEITGFEALLRWQRPGQGLISPADFVPLLEETGLIVPVGEWIIDAACAQICAWRQAGVEPRPIAINLSPRQFNDKNLGHAIRRAVDAHWVESDLLELEITESSLMHNTEEAIATLKYLKSIGLKISIDDFGTGYSSLAYLKRFPLDALKVDRSFVRDISSDADDAAITRAIIGMAHSLGLKVIAEGVETEAQLAFLKAHGCEQMQGYYFSRPVPAHDCGVMLREGKRLALPAPL